MFNSLSNPVLKQIAVKFINELKHRLSLQDMDLEVSDAAYARMLLLGTDVQYGARPLKRHIQREIENRIARLIIEQPSDKPRMILIDVVDDEYSVEFVASVKNMS